MPSSLVIDLFFKCLFQILLHGIPQIFQHVHGDDLSKTIVDGYHQALILEAEIVQVDESSVQKCHVEYERQECMVRQRIYFHVHQVQVAQLNHLKVKLSSKFSLVQNEHAEKVGDYGHTRDSLHGFWLTKLESVSVDEAHQEP